MLICIALRYVPDEEVARELVQEAFLQAYLSLDQLREAARFKNWLYGIVVNMCRNWLRTYKGMLLTLNAPSGRWPFFVTPVQKLTPDPQDIVVEQELQQIVREAVQMLSPRNRSAMQLFYYERLSIQEIATLLDISLAAVKSRMYKGREQLPTHLQTLYPELGDVVVSRKETPTMMIPMKLAKVLHVEKFFCTIVVLLDEAEQRALPLWFSKIQEYMTRTHALSSGQEIPTEPLTTDFIVHILNAFSSTIEEIAIDTLSEEMLYARVQVRSQNTVHTIKARLEDALPLALRLNCPFTVSEDILVKQSVTLLSQNKTREQQIDEIVNRAITTPPMRMGNSHTFVTSTTPRNLDFSENLRGWYFYGSPTTPKYYDVQLDTRTRYNHSKNSLAMTLHRPDPSEQDAPLSGMVIAT